MIKHDEANKSVVATLAAEVTHPKSYPAATVLKSSLEQQQLEETSNDDMIKMETAGPFWANLGPILATI